MLHSLDSSPKYLLLGFSKWTVVAVSGQQNKYKIEESILNPGARFSRACFW